MAPTGCPARDSCAPKLSDHRRVSSKAVSRFACHTHSIPVLLTCGRCMACVGQGRASELSVRPPVEHAPGTPSPGNAEPRERRAPARREPALQAKFFDFPHPQPASGSAAQKRHGVEPVPLFEIAVKLRSRARIFVGCSGVSITADDHEYATRCETQHVRPAARRSSHAATRHLMRIGGHRHGAFDRDLPRPVAHPYTRAR